MGGTFEDYTVVGTRYIHGKKTYLDRTRALAADDTWKGFYVVVLKADSDESSLGNGYAGLSVQVMANGRGRVTGTMPDGTKVAYSGRMEVMDGNVCVLPAAIPLHRGKKGNVAQTVPSVNIRCGGVVVYRDVVVAENVLKHGVESFVDFFSAHFYNLRNFI